MSPGGRIPPDDPSQAARFSITIDGVEIAQFSELVELSSGLDPSDLARHLNQKRRAAPKKASEKRITATVTLRRGQTTDLGLFEWHRDALGRAAARRDAILVMFSTRGQPVARFNLQRAWPAKLEIGGPQAGASQVLFETVTLACEDIQRVSP